MSSNLLQEILAEIKSYPDGIDLLITALYTAAHHYRRSTICTPFPSEVFAPVPNTSDKDFQALQCALDALPPVHSFLRSDADDLISKLPPSVLGLLKWMLLNPSRRRRFTLTTLGDMVRHLRQRAAAGGGGGSSSGSDGSWQLPSLSGPNSPAYILRVHHHNLPQDQQQGFSISTTAAAATANGTGSSFQCDGSGGGVIAYHGTHLENLHSIIHTGLQSMSGTRLQRTGANFGAGIYLSTNYDTAFSFCQPCDSWPRSRFGSKLRALLVCEVDRDKYTLGRGPGSGPSQVPETYLVVQRADAVRLLYIMLYCDAPRTARPARVNWCTVMVVLYAAFLLGKALLAALQQHRY
ncbi:hypothetical protein VOLCADRAFT_107792 [Volvox carteri f. nagariensis]|uniref:PARP n=1 Tax=Volvox carteri f. nagariensis TaxID=3068 RepID=D8UGE5_VOLCA|nr:uncharacterized protein VOLCADRAFT_107792 [Volvox carteri f. nagariensis]EFJ41185.1 hypothetical protein VOLCADRAFT_107792 [Volvox carteri f. nagariensis]|eukprot:XP_002957753.1 hypothetical protein VOLCADRAFT_107792 [Volvox carteri f. nagariensis]